MNKILVSLLTCVFFGIVLLLSCKKELSCEDCIENIPPIAVAGVNQSILLPIDSVTLDASGSNDPDGTIKIWRWTRIAGPAAMMVDSTDSVSMGKKLVKGVYQFELSVTDNRNATARDTVQVTVADIIIPNRPPVADAGKDQLVIQPSHRAILDGSGSSDPDNNIVSQQWKIISGPSSNNISDANTLKTRASDLGLGVYKIELTVTDAEGLFSKDTITITVNPCATNLVLPGVCDNSLRPVICAQLNPVGELSVGRINMSVVAVGNKILFAGGYSGAFEGTTRVDIFDISTNSWTTAELSRARHTMATVAVGNKVFFAGGQIASGNQNTYFSDIDIYDASTNTWSTATLSAPRSQISAAAVGNKVLFAGGESDLNHTKIYHAHSEVDVYNLSTNTWSVEHLSQPRIGMVAVAADNKIYFAGGHAGSPGYAVTDLIDIYDYNLNGWSTSNMQSAKVNLSGILVGDNIYWAGGATVAPFGQVSCGMEVRNIRTGATSTGNLFSPAVYVNNFSQNAIHYSGKLVFCRPLDIESHIFDVYDIAANRWSVGIMPQTIANSSFISVNNSIYVSGIFSNGVFSKKVYKLEF